MINLMNNKIKTFGIAIATVAFSLGLSSCSKIEVRTDPPVQNKPKLSSLLTLNTTIDEKTKLSKDSLVKFGKLANKSRKLAEYAITKEKYPHISKTSISVYSSFKLDGVKYSLTIIDINDRNVCRTAVDMIQIGVYFPWKNDERETLLIRDTGLDGRVDLGENLILKEDMENDFNNRKYFDKEHKKGIEHREFYQKKFENLLDKLIEFYEKK